MHHCACFYPDENTSGRFPLYLHDFKDHFPRIQFALAIPDDRYPGCWDRYSIEVIVTVVKGNRDKNTIISE